MFAPSRIERYWFVFGVCFVYLTFSFQREHRQFAKISFPPIAARIANETGLEVNIRDVGLFWEICAYEKAIWNVTNRFCTLFQPHDHELLSYWSDLSFYWRRGYGNPL